MWHCNNQFDMISMENLTSDISAVNLYGHCMMLNEYCGTSNDSSKVFTQKTLEVCMTSCESCSLVMWKHLKVLIIQFYFCLQAIAAPVWDQCFSHVYSPSLHHMDLYLFTIASNYSHFLSQSFYNVSCWIISSSRNFLKMHFFLHSVQD